ncbi:LysR family transcriptional regulator [Mycobacterium sp. NPDC003323]
MDIRQLKFFLAVVDHGTVHRAAEELYVAQPSVSHSLRRLEDELGTELFMRRGRGLVLNSAGEALVAPARELVQLLEVARATVESVDGLRGGRLTVASMPSQAVSPLTELIARFTRRYPGVEVVVLAADRPDDVRDALRTGAAELGVLARPRTTAGFTDLERRHIEVQQFVLVTTPGVDLPEEPIALDALRGLPLIVGQPGTGMRRVADTILAGTDCRLVVEIEHREALLPLVLSGVGAAVVAESWRALAESVGLAVHTLVTDDELDVELVWHPRRLSPAAEAFVATTGTVR